MLPIHSFFDELVKLGSVSDDQARRSLDRLDTLEKNKPTARTALQYGALGAVAGPAISGIAHTIEHGVGKKPMFGGARGLAGQAVKGALSAGAVPIVQKALDRHSEMGTIKKYVKQDG